MFFKKSDLKIHKEDFLLLPNILTYVRFLLVPVFIIVYMNAELLSDHLTAAIIVVLSGITDVVDGFIARHWNLVSDLGKIIDPIADKCMQFAMMFCVCVKYRWVIILIIIYAVKELVSALISGYLFTRGKHIEGAVWAGKLCTVILFLVMLVLIALPRVPVLVVMTMIGFASAFMILAFFIYLRAYFLLWLEYLNEQKQPLMTDLSPLDRISAEYQEPAARADAPDTSDAPDLQQVPDLPDAPDSGEASEETSQGSAL